MSKDKVIAYLVTRESELRDWAKQEEEVALSIHDRAIEYLKEADQVLELRRSLESQ